MNRAGDYVLNMSGEAAYRSFCPAPLPPNPPVALSEETQRLLQDATVHLAELRTASALIPDMELFVSMYVRKEALLSSQIEGTQCTLEDVLDPGAEENANLDVSDVINYVDAVNFAVERLNTLPLCSRFLRETHRVLMKGVRGQEKDPGEFRRSQNWIGAANCGLKDARYIPPNVEDMKTAMADLESYMNECEEDSPLVRAALIHYQFETIHPFLDGNGRIGRLLIVLYLIEQQVLDVPAIYVSFFLKKNQLEYYDRISEVRKTGNYEQWIHFFLEALNAAAQDAMASIRKMTLLRAASLTKLPKTNRSVDTVRLVFDYLERHPIIDIGHTARALSLSFNTVSSAVRKLEAAGILRQTANAARNRVFVYEAYLSILRGKEGSEAE